MRVCFLVTSLAHVSGINRVISLVGNALVDRYDIYIVATEQNDPDTDQAFALDPRIHVLSAASLKIQPSFIDRCRLYTAGFNCTFILYQYACSSITKSIVVF